MDSEPHDPLSLAESKERLRGGHLRWRHGPPAAGRAGPPSLGEVKERVRSTAEQAGPTAWVGRHPLGALLAALTGGMAMGSFPRGMRKTLRGSLLGMLLRHL
ncbi:hypothetical protein [Thiohalorhabdus methylotrophus]|uniref:Uncharacterized protein n=1 Tax=Thiohalorhabdus methylotrophus TaxID=3242694 RepID=A0ABV4TUN7_9GAMM